MNILHSTWFWVAIILAPVGTVVGILSRLARRTAPDAAHARTVLQATDGASSGQPPSEPPEEKDLT